jgi:hypothetical protein
MIVKRGRARHGTDDSIVRRMCFACWITKATNTHLEYVILIAFRNNNVHLNAHSSCVYTHIACLFNFSLSHPGALMALKLDTLPL